MDITYDIQKPEAGANRTVQVERMDNLIIDNRGVEVIQQIENQLIVEYEDGALLVFEDFENAVLITLGDTTIPMEIFVSALNQEPLETAAGREGGGGAGEYRDDMGESLEGINKLGGQDPDPFGRSVNLQLDDENDLLVDVIDIPDIALRYGKRHHAF